MTALHHGQGDVRHHLASPSTNHLFTTPQSGHLGASTPRLDRRPEARSASRTGRRVWHDLYTVALANIGGHVEPVRLQESWSSFAWALIIECWPDCSRAWTTAKDTYGPPHMERRKWQESSLSAWNGGRSKEEPTSSTMWRWHGATPLTYLACPLPAPPFPYIDGSKYRFHDGAASSRIMMLRDPVYWQQSARSATKSRSIKSRRRPVVEYKKFLRWTIE